MTLLEKIKEIDASVTSAESAEFAGCLIWIMRGLGEELAPQSSSLRNLTSTLDGAGYDVACFISILRQISIAELGMESASSLWLYIQSMLDEQNGVQSLRDYVNRHYPELEIRISSLHALAEQDAHLLEHTAGGLGVAGGVGVGVGIVASLAIGTLAYKKLKGKKVSVESVELYSTQKLDGEVDKQITDATSLFSERDLAQGGVFNRDGTYARHYDDYSSVIEPQMRDTFKNFDFKSYADDKLLKMKNSVGREWKDWKIREASELRKAIIGHRDGLDEFQRLGDDEFKFMTKLNEAYKNRNLYGSWEDELVNGNKFSNDFDNYCKNRFCLKEWAEAFLDNNGNFSESKAIAFYETNEKYARQHVYTTWTEEFTIAEDHFYQGVRNAVSDGIKAESNAVDEELRGVAGSTGEAVENEERDVIGFTKNAESDV